MAEPEWDDSGVFFTHPLASTKYILQFATKDPIPAVLVVIGIAVLSNFVLGVRLFNVFESQISISIHCICISIFLIHITAAPLHPVQVLPPSLAESP